jgi:hypothetical protein
MATEPNNLGLPGTRTVRLTPKPQHAEDTRQIRDAYRTRVLDLIFRAGWAHRHECALATVPDLALPAATRRAQRMLAGALRDGLVLRRYLASGDCIYGLTASGARWLSEMTGMPAHATTVALNEASRIEHRRTATQIAVLGELLGCHSMHERELYKRIGDWRRNYDRLPDALLTWQSGEAVEASWHEVDRSHRNPRDLSALRDVVRALAATNGRLRGSANTQLVAMVFHVRAGRPENQLRREFATLWSGGEWGADDVQNGIFPAPGFIVLIQPSPPADYWPVRDDLLLPWRSGLVALPNEERWSTRYQRFGPAGALTFLRTPSPGGGSAR